MTNRDSDDPTTLTADLVIDATGRATHTPALLERNGFGSPPEKRDRGELGLLRPAADIPAGRITPRMVSMLDQGKTLDPPAAAGVRTQHLDAGDRRSHQARTSADRLRATCSPSAEQILPATVMTGLRAATPVGDISIFRNTASVWRRYDQMAQLPAGVLVIGDALCTLDPIWGQGMTMAAVQALTLHDCLREGTTDLPRRFFTSHECRTSVRPGQ